ncbi:MAG: rhomboid family intramembrane serine protease [Thioalkalispiraceae bacterium]|jgi:membrane associated rhomboid family serine protease
MFLPLERKPDWRNPPLITLILVIANVMIFYMWQHNDTRYENTAYGYYESSNLDITELKKYSEYRKNESRQQDEAQVKLYPGDLFKDMIMDGEFQKKLAANEIIKPGDPEFSDWRSKRDTFEAMLNKSVATKYALNPSRPSLLTYFTSMFIHANSAHLIGNMIMLILLGLGIEILMGRLLFLLGYILSGLAGNQLYVMLNSDTFTYGLGASGAIAGVLGMAIIIYGIRKINFFYFLFVYFDFIRARAIWILPLYILSQVIIYFVFGSEINVAAHLGGLLGGLGFTAVVKLIPNAINEDYIDESDRKEIYTKGFAAAQQLIASMKIDEARKKFLALEKQYPDDIKIMQQLFTIAKYNPASEDYHHYAHKLLMLPDTDPKSVKAMFETYQHYAAKAKPKPRWTPELLANIAIKFAAGGKLDDAEKIANILVKAMKDFEKNAEVLSALVKHYKNVDADKSVQYKNTLLDLYPDSAEAKHVH